MLSLHHRRSCFCNQNGSGPPSACCRPGSHSKKKIHICTYTIGFLLFSSFHPSSTIPIILPHSNFFNSTSTFPLESFNSFLPINFPVGKITGAAVLNILNNSCAWGSSKKWNDVPVEIKACKHWALMTSAWLTLKGISRPYRCKD